MHVRLAAIVDHCWPFWAAEFDIGYRAFRAANIYDETGWLAAQIEKEWHGSGVYGPAGADLGTVVSDSASEELSHFHALRRLSEAMNPAPEDYAPGPAARALTVFRNSLWPNELTRHAVAMSEGGGLGLFHGALAAVRVSHEPRPQDALVTACLEPIIADEAGHLGGAIQRYLNLAVGAGQAVIVMEQLAACLALKVAERREQFAASLAQEHADFHDDPAYQSELADYCTRIASLLTAP